MNPTPITQRTVDLPWASDEHSGVAMSQGEPSPCGVAQEGGGRPASPLGARGDEGQG